MPSENNTVPAVTESAPTSTGVGNKGAAAVGSNGSDEKSPTTINSAPSFDPTEYVQKQRVTKTTPPKPAYNPLQFIQIKPCNLYQSAQDQLRKAEEVKKAKVTKKEDAEDWQGNLDSWKSSRRKRVEHIIERVVEVKKLEIEEHDRQRKKSKTFSEMMEERGGRRKISLPVFTEDESNDFSDLGIGTSSASGKSSMSEDFDNHSVISDNPETEKSSDVEHLEINGNRRNFSSPGYETSSSTAPTTSPDPADYPRYAGERFQTPLVKERPLKPTKVSPSSKESSPELRNGDSNKFVAKRPSVTKIEDRLVNFELKSSTTETSENQTNGQVKKDLPKVDITKRREMFEKEQTPDKGNRSSGDFGQVTPTMSIKERLSNLEKQKEEANNTVSHQRLPVEITSIKDRLRNLEREKETSINGAPKFDVSLGGSIKDRLSSLHSAKDSGDYSPSVTKTAVVVGMAKKPEVVAAAVPVEFDRVIEVEALKIEIEQIELAARVIPSEATEPESLIAMDSIQDAVQDYVTIVQDMKEKEEYREITDEDLFGGTDIEVDVEIDNLQQDASVLEALDIAFEAIDKGADTQETVAISPSNRPPSSDHAAAASCAPAAATTTNFEQLTGGDACPNGAMDNDKDIEQFIDDLIEQNNGGEKEEVTVPKEMELVDQEPIYEIIEDVSQPKPLKSALKSPKKQISSRKLEEEMKVEPYYEVPNRNPIPLYENVDIFLANEAANQGQLIPTLEPPKVKPPPPPVESEGEEEESDDGDEGSVLEEEPQTPEENLRRMNSTKRIKKDIRIKRSSFLGIESTQDDEVELKMTIAPPPDMSALIEEERRLEKQFLKTYDGIVERSDSGVSESHSRQSSEPFTGSSEEQDDRSKELEDVGQRREWCEEAQMQNFEDQIREQEEVLRVERELLQIEQEELKRQRTNLLLRENYARKELNHGSKMLMSANRLSLQDINENVLVGGQQLPSHLSSSASSTNSSTQNVPSQIPNLMPMPQDNVPMEYRQSMPNLNQHLGAVLGHSPINPLMPPAKPSRLQGYSNGYSQEYLKANGKVCSTNDLGEEFVQLRDHSSSNQPGNMSRHTLHALSAVPKPKLTDVWVQQQQATVTRSSEPNGNKYFPIQRKAPITTQDRLSGGEQWIARKPDPPKGLGYGKHWLIQEAEQRRLDQQRGVRPTPNPQNWPIKGAGDLHRKSMPDISSEKKPLPDAVINTITQRLHSRMGVGNGMEKRRFDANPAVINSNPSLDEGSVMDTRQRNQEQVLSVSGKKKCSHCDEELGRGAAMIVESLRLFYHIDCFKCCVCLVRLGDGMNGTDVRVRNHKLHCQNCYSSDDGIKFSCV